MPLVTAAAYAATALAGYGYPYGRSAAWRGSAGVTPTEEDVTDERGDTETETAVVVASDVTRRYGAGDTAVDALRGVSVECPARAS